MALPSSPIWRYHAALFTAVALWSLAYIGIRVGIRDFSPGAAALFRYAIASLCLLPIAWRIPWRNFTLSFAGVCFALGWLSIGVYNLALNIAEKTVSSGTAALFLGQMPVLVAFMAVVFLRESIAVRGYIGFAISVFGMLLMSGVFNHDVAYGLSVDLLLVAVLAGSILTTMQRYIIKKIPPVQFMALIIWSGTLSLSIFWPELRHELPHAALSCDAWVIFNGIFPAAVAYSLWGIGLTRVPVSIAAGYLYFMPVFSVINGWVILGELPAIHEFYGAIIAFVGSVIVTRARCSPPPMPLPQDQASASSASATETLSTVC